jgi:hypothetical protein
MTRHLWKWRHREETEIELAAVCDAPKLAAGHHLRRAERLIEEGENLASYWSARAASYSDCDDYPRRRRHE